MKNKKITTVFILLFNSLLVFFIFIAISQIKNVQASGPSVEASLQEVTQVNATPTPDSFSEEPLTGESPPNLYAAPLALNPNDHFYFTRPVIVDANTWNASNFIYGIGEDDPQQPPHRCRYQITDRHISLCSWVWHRCVGRLWLISE